jgi:hypothetical protein
MYPAEPLFDTFSEVNLISQKLADRHGFLYTHSNKAVKHSMGGLCRVVGEVIGPVLSVLKKGEPSEMSTFSNEATSFLVVSGVEEMYDVLLSVHVARDWGAMPDPILQRLNFRPLLYSPQRDIDTMDFVPLRCISQTSQHESVAGVVTYGFCGAGVLRSRAVSSGAGAGNHEAESASFIAEAERTEKPGALEKDAQECATVSSKCLQEDAMQSSMQRPVFEGPRSNGRPVPEELRASERPLPERPVANKSVYQYGLWSGSLDVGIDDAAYSWDGVLGVCSWDEVLEPRSWVFGVV